MASKAETVRRSGRVELNAISGARWFATTSLVFGESCRLHFLTPRHRPHASARDVTRVPAIFGPTQLMPSSRCGLPTGGRQSGSGETHASYSSESARISSASTSSSPALS